MDKFERLRALEKKFQDEATVARDTFKYGGGEYYDGRRDAFNLAADELATLIAELGQEVGAVAWTKDAEAYGNALNEAAWKFVEECPEKSALLFNNTKKPLRAAILTYAEHVARATSPAHTSEARDAARYRALKTHFQAKFHRATCDYWVIVGELKTDPRFIGEDGEQLTLDNALDAAIAAMRQEGGK